MNHISEAKKVPELPKLNANIPASIANSDDEPPADANLVSPRKKFFFNSYSTVTYTDVTLATTTVFSTCFHTIQNTVICNGRRKKRQLIPDEFKGLVY